jgi:hypothetical protein
MKKFRKAVAVFLITMTVTSGINQASAGVLGDVSSILKNHSDTADTIAKVADVSINFIMDMINNYFRYREKVRYHDEKLKKLGEDCDDGENIKKQNQECVYE